MSPFDRVLGRIGLFRSAASADAAERARFEKERAALAEERSRLMREYQGVVAERDEGNHQLGRARVLHHQPERLAGEVAIVQRSTPNADDRLLVERVVAAYTAAMRTPVGSSDSIWLDFFAHANKSTHKILSSGNPDRIAAMLQNPADSMLFYGFDNLSAAESGRNAEPGWRHWLHLLCYSSLLKLAEAVGVQRLDNPEAPYEGGTVPAVDGLLKALDGALGFRIEFPNFFPGEVGLVTTRGIASYRAIQALYQAYRIKQLVGNNPHARVLEIGAGLGRTAFYACRAGVRQYTIIDIPLTNVAQGYFLGRAMGEAAVRLWAEEGNATVTIAPPADFLGGTERYELIVNFDSLTEMSPATARSYLDAAASRSAAFLSINHEHNAFTVRELYLEAGIVPISRTPCWVRRGYVEELLEFQR